MIDEILSNYDKYRAKMQNIIAVYPGEWVLDEQTLLAIIKDAIEQDKNKGIVSPN